MIPHLPDGKDFRVEAEFHAVDVCVLRQRDVERKRTHDAGRRSIEGSHRLVRDVGLHLHELVPLNDPKVRDAVFLSLLQEFLKTAPCCFVRADDKGADPLKGDIQIPCELCHHRIALDVELCHEGARLAVVARVDDGAVGFGGSAADVLRLLEDTDVCVIAGELSCDRTAADAGSDNYHIIHVHFSFSRRIKKRERAAHRASARSVCTFSSLICGLFNCGTPAFLCPR